MVVSNKLFLATTCRSRLYILTITTTTTKLDWIETATWADLVVVVVGLTAVVLTTMTMRVTMRRRRRRKRRRRIAAASGRTWRRRCGTSTAGSSGPYELR